MARATTDRHDSRRGSPDGTQRKANRPHLTLEALWDIHDVSQYLRVPVETLYQWRKRKYGPPAARVGRFLRYDPADVRAWFKAQAA